MCSQISQQLGSVLILLVESLVNPAAKEAAELHRQIKEKAKRVAEKVQDAGHAAAQITSSEIARRQQMERRLPLLQDLRRQSTRLSAGLSSRASTTDRGRHQLLLAFVAINAATFTLMSQYQVTATSSRSTAADQGRAEQGADKSSPEQSGRSCLLRQLWQLWETVFKDVQGLDAAQFEDFGFAFEDASAVKQASGSQRGLPPAWPEALDQVAVTRPNSAGWPPVESAEHVNSPGVREASGQWTACCQDSCVGASFFAGCESSQVHSSWFGRDVDEVLTGHIGRIEHDSSGAASTSQLGS